MSVKESENIIHLYITRPRVLMMKLVENVSRYIYLRKEQILFAHDWHEIMFWYLYDFDYIYKYIHIYMI